jgi:two-component system CheB/CheR fusion protein
MTPGTTAAGDGAGKDAAGGEAAAAAGQGAREEAAEETPVLPERENVDALTVVGIGASAGGIRALQTFFEAAPADGGSAYVVVLHLSPEHESRLAEVLQRSTPMPVRQVNGPTPVEANRVYVIPPDKHLMMDDGVLRLADARHPQGRRVAIDRFFRTLAESRGPQAVGVVLSGTGADGALGLKLLKEMGGLTVAQEPEDAEHDTMPRNAIATGMVDYVLPAGEMPARIAAYWEASRRMRLPGEAAPSPGQREEGPEQEIALQEILAHVRAQTRHDFAVYKRATVLRRIGRRMQVAHRPDLPAYLDFLRGHPTEADDLVGDLLISVTQFFRDPAAWEALARDVIPRLFEDKGPDDEVRAWTCGCATGEEAYTLAILLLEQAARMERPPRLLVFATDMDDAAIAHAREGSYPETIAADVAPERLRRWFTLDSGRYRIRREVRETVLFASHDVLRNTPFSRLDLVTCRNLLIYLNRDAQERALETFHFALRPEGLLMLGPAESVDGAAPLFSPRDRQHRIYVRRPVARPIPPPAIAPGLRVPFPAAAAATGTAESANRPDGAPVAAAAARAPSARFRPASCTASCWRCTRPRRCWWTRTTRSSTCPTARRATCGSCPASPPRTCSG